MVTNGRSDNAGYQLVKQTIERPKMLENILSTN